VKRAQALERQGRRRTLRDLLRGPGALGEHFALDDHVRDERALVGRPRDALAIDGRGRVVFLRPLLQHGFRIRPGKAQGQIGLDVLAQHEGARRSAAGERIEHGDERFERVSQTRPAPRFGRLRQPPAVEHQPFEAEPLRRASVRFIAHERRLAQRQLALARAGELRVEPACHDRSQDRVAQKLQPFVRAFGRAFVHRALVSERGLDRLRVDVFETEARQKRAQPRATLLARHQPCFPNTTTLL
jgi:hypothetical protein